MSLRDDLIEAGARIWHYDMEMWEEDDIAAAFLDTFLDTLADRADEWMVQALHAAYGNVRGNERLDADDLIAVLRGDT